MRSRRRTIALVAGAALAVVTTMALVPMLSAQAASTAVAAACTAPNWAEGNTYTAGTQVTYQGHTYQALQTHTAYPGAGWNPAATPSLWKDLGTCGGTGPTTPPPTTSSGVPSAPGNLRITATTNTSLALAWNASTGTVTGYRVYEGSTVKATVTGTSTTVSGLSAGTTHTYTVKAYNGQGESGASNSVTGTTTGGTTNPGTGTAAPYLYMGWGDPPNPQTVQQATGIKWFTMAFVLSSGGCTPAWDGSRPLTGGVDQTAINQIRAGGGDVVPSFGGWSGNKLGPNCSTPQALAGAYQTVINTYGLKAIDIDIENTDEFENDTVRNRIVDALKIVKQNNPSLRTIVTFGTATTGPGYYAQQLISRAQSTGANIDVFTIMPFDFGGGANMYQSTVSASEGLKTMLKSTFGWDDATAYRHMGISGMNGLSDQQENTSPAQWQQIRDYAQNNHLARLAFWSVNRDRPCPGGGVVSNCSGVAQNNWQYTQITATFTG